MNRGNGIFTRGVAGGKEGRSSSKESSLPGKLGSLVKRHVWNGRKVELPNLGASIISAWTRS